MAAISHIALTILASLLLASAAADEERKVYIVYMGDQTSSNCSTLDQHLGLLKEILVGCTPGESLVYSYTKSFNGFAAKLTISEAEKIAEMKGIVSVFASRMLKTRTTRSWDFLQFPQNVYRNIPLERDVIIGMLDTGIWPESESFSDEGFGPPPSKWRGVCVNFKCNNKVIGARYYNSVNDTTQEASPRDFEGHGTHTSSAAAGRGVPGASLYGLAGGTARGAVPSARIAVYKVCWSFGCADQDILAAFDDAIADGVDIISVSLGHFFPIDYFGDTIAIGAFHAMKNGVLTSASAGNNGPGHGTVSNIAPWMLVTAASSTDRRIIDRVRCAKPYCSRGWITVVEIETSELYVLVLIYRDCSQLDNEVVAGKIVLCNFISDVPFLAGAKGVVMMDDGTNLDTSYTWPAPAAVVSNSDGKKLAQYINKSKNAVANIHKSEAVYNPKAPVVATFSSRGPNIITPDILKPDISAPGVEILAAWSPLASVSGFTDDTRSVNYNIISGTSMACPHVTGAAAYVKSFHPNWSPAAIMSALITTAKPMNPSLNKDAELAYGAGQLNPVKAIDPGLIYDATARDYVQMLCDAGYNKSMIRIITGDERCCSASVGRSVRDLNYPSMAFHVKANEKFVGTFSRTVTNVGDNGCSKYAARIKADHRLNVVIYPKTLLFGRLFEKKEFTVTVSGGPLPVNSTASASITWSDGKHSVRSAMVVYTDFTD
ncbi:subtilisin-like protease SBT4.3 [Canna indica]|uniref:Subtilisin-like protease SBT4.3 n=1 Tax=Canna indica TaxID=4628 RepID=A0AAQ3Q6E8_9LILI|nr:subtilisin-like protease SBT4.3 [Canna indica]